MQKVLGIDLGTTYSCAAYIDHSEKPVVVKNREGELTTPSVVFFETAESVVVGNSAKESSRLYPDEVVSFVKRSIGQQGACWNLHGTLRTPSEISSYILKKVVGDAVETLRSETLLGPEETITDVVITCPAYFGVNEREATRQAGEIAGLHVVGIINEPTAAAIAYGVANAHENKVVLVYDLGGGTFDITMIAINAGAIQVICTGGDHSLGGKLWDDRIIQYLAEEFARQTGNTEDILADPETLQELALSAERAKKMLSARDKAPVAINYKGNRARVELTRTVFDEMTRDLLERTVMLTQEMLEEAKKKGYSLDKVEEILLVGGSTRMPQVTERIGQEFAIPSRSFDPDEAVAKGAALYASRQAAFDRLLETAARETGKSREKLGKELSMGLTSVEKLALEAGISPDELGGAVNMDIVNVTSRSFGTIAIQTEGEREEVLCNLILRNTPLPAREKRQFFTVAPNQQSVTIRVLESLSSQELAQPLEGTEIGETVLELPPGLAAGSPLEIEFTLNEGGLLELEAQEITGGRQVSARFETVDAITAEELDEAKKRLEETQVV
ncbi:Hsp70 family protein [Oscillospiraceae bacterium MB08-C2-2]|nr:Hsp70 family protein [Oscillospiraceae bacterium MB08-C2-2]